MRLHHSMHFHSALLARPSMLLTQGNAATGAAAATTCAIGHRLQQFKPQSSVRRCSSTSTTQHRTTLPQPKVYIRKPLTTQRCSSTISSNPPPPATSHRARQSKPVYQPPSSSPSSARPTELETVPIPDPTTSYAAPMTHSTHQPSSSSSFAPAPSTRLTWNAFLTLRKTRRRYNLLASVSTSLLTTSVGISALAQQNIETVGLFGFDPFMVLGLATAGSGAVGWLLGPFVGNAVFAWAYRDQRADMAAKERDLFRRIKLHRVDPSSSSAGNPVPDYYGEKIGSVAEYRTWMKDQRAYNKRRQTFL